MIDFAALPPEVNSARMYAGAGAAPLLSAATSWDALATQLSESAAEFRATVTALAEAWIGPSASAMTASAMTFVSWLTSSAAAAAETATQATAAASAYETAFAATVPPSLIMANRALLTSLLASNYLGINSAAIMATEALYAEMWAQDVAAMSAYSAESAAATTALPQLTAAPQTTTGTTPQTTPATTPASTQTILSWLLGQLSNSGTVLGELNAYGQSFVSSGPYEIPLSLLSLFTVLWGINSPSSPLAQAITNRIGGTVIESPPLATPVTTPETTRAAIKAGMADGEKLGGRLSVPPGWAQQRETPKPDRGPVATPLDRPESPGLAGLAGMGGLGGLAGMRGTPTKQQQHTPQYGTRLTVMPKHPLGG